MVARLLGLKLRLIANTFRRGPWPVLGLMLGALYGVTVAVFGVGSLVAARSIGDEEFLRDILIVVGGAVLLGFLVLPLISRTDDPLDPRRFALFDLPNVRLAGGLAIAGLLGTPALVLLVCALATIATWSRGFGVTLLATICALIAVSTCLLAARVSRSIAAFRLGSRRSGVFSTVVWVLLIVIISPIALILMNADWTPDGVASLATVADWAGWTPFGAVWSIPGDAALGEWGVAILKLVIALVFVGLLWAVWNALVARMLVTPDREERSAGRGGLGWFDLLPRRPAGAIAARSITYWGRDVRYWVTLVIIPIFPAIMVVALLIGGVPGHDAALVPLPIMCLFLGWTIHNDVAYDSTAIWLHIVSGTRGMADRIGRVFPVLLIGVPLVVVGSIVTVVAYGDWDVFPAVIGVSSGILLSGAGLSSASSARFPYPASKPGDSAFSQPQSTGSTGTFVQSISLLVVVALSAPAIAFGLMGMGGDAGWFFAALAAGLVVGVGTLVAGLCAGASVFNRRGPEIMAAALRND